MRKSFLFLFAVSVFLSSILQASAQAPQTPPPTPRVLFIFREDVKAARTGDHEQHEIGYVRALQKANWPTLSLALSSIAGANDAWFISGYESYAAMEKDFTAMRKNEVLMKEFSRLDAADAEFRTNQRGIIVTLREDISHQVPVVIPQMRYFQINTVRVRPGHEEEWFEARRILVEALKKAKVDTPSTVFQVAAGMPNGTFLVITPRKSLAEMDPNPDRGRAVREALGEDGINKRRKLISDSVITSETSIYGFSPGMSYVTKEFARAGGEDFWHPKPMVALKRVSRKAAEKNTARKQQ
jgi:hypothetical protein